MLHIQTGALDSILSRPENFGLKYSSVTFFLNNQALQALMTPKYTRSTKA